MPALVRILYAIIADAPLLATFPKAWTPSVYPDGGALISYSYSSSSRTNAARTMALSVTVVIEFTVALLPDDPLPWDELL